MAKAKAKLPRKVAGVKVPKGLRKQAKQALKLAASPVARELAIAGLTIAAERALDRLGAKQKAKAALDRLELAEVVRAAAAEGARRFLEGFEATAAKAKAKPPAKPKAAPKPAAKPAPRKRRVAKARTAAS